ncbi:MAG: hypothetical protein LPK85_06075, partial [Gammaproteobacteria bacterium]|nr:hypothetical protein [Gammaproteobacteria bacterium]
MKLRKLAVALALVGGLGSNLAHALGLGGAELRSNLNEPLRAEIALVGLGSVSPADITARLASSTDFQRAGVERAAWLADLQFRVIRDGQNRPVVEVSSRRPIREPFVNFLVELNWPSGRLLREYALLVDPPLYRPAPLAAPSVPSSSVRAPTSAPQVREPARAPAPSAPGESRYTGQPGSYGPVRADDTLWSIALRTRPDSSITPQQMMLAIQDQNPDAFQNGNINRLKRGAVLRIPDRQQAMQRTPREAFAQVTAQNEQLRRPSTERAPVDATARAPRPAAPAAPTPGDDELRLIVADTDKPQEQASHGGAVAVEGGTGGDTRLALTMEQLDKAQRDNAELSTRVKALEEQLQTMQRLVEVKDDRLSQLQAQMGGVAEAGSDAVVPGVDALPTAGDAGQAVATESTSSDTPAAVTSTGTAAASAEPVPTGEAATSTDMTVAPEAEATADVAPEPAVVAATETPVQPTVPAPVPAPAREPDLFEQIMTNPLYMIAAGGSAVLLLIILGLIARRNANQEKHFYDALKQTEAESGDERPIDLGAGLAGASSGASRATTVDGEDPLAEADIYLAYGRLDQAASVLEGAISKEPTRADLRLKLLEVYKGIGDNAAFEKQYQEIASMDDAAALRQADALRDRGGDEEGPSLSELQSALKSTGAGGAASVAAKTAAVAGGAYMVAREDVPAEPEGAEKSESIDFDLTGIDLKGIKGEAVETETTPLTQEAEGSDWISDFDLEIEESPAAVVEAVESAADELGMLEADFELDEAALDEHDGVEGAASLEEDDDTLLADLDL